MGTVNVPHSSAEGKAVMGVKFDMKGLNQLQRRLKDLERKARGLNGQHQIPLSDLFPPSFLRVHTRFSSLDGPSTIAPAE